MSEGLRDETELTEEKAEDSAEKDNSSKNEESEKKGDVYEGAIICGLSLALLIIGACLKNYSVAHWLYTFSFVLAGYEILYSLIVKLCKKAVVIAEITILVASVILLYCGSSVNACIVVLGYSAFGLIEKSFTYNALKRAEYYENVSGYETDEQVKLKFKRKAENLKLLLTEKPNDKIYCNKFKLYLGIGAIVLGAVAAFIPPLIKISSYGTLLVNKWLPCGALIAALTQITVTELLNFLCYYSAIKSADEFDTQINSFATIDELSLVNRVYFDKTGVITQKTVTITGIIDCKDEVKVLSVINACETNIDEEIRSAIKRFTKEKGFELNEPTFSKAKYTAGKGITATADGKEYVIGSEKFLSDNGIGVDPYDGEESVICVAENGEYLGKIIIKYVDKPSFNGVISEIKDDLGLKSTLISSDRLATVDSYKKKFGFDGAISCASTEYKITKVKESNSLYVGDGDKDGEVLNKLDKGVCIGKACGGEGVVIVDENDERSVPRLLKLAKRTRKYNKIIKLATLIAKIAIVAGCVALCAFKTDLCFIIPILNLVCDAALCAVALSNVSEAV